MALKAGDIINIAGTSLDVYNYYGTGVCLICPNDYFNRYSKARRALAKAGFLRALSKYDEDAVSPVVDISVLNAVIKGLKLHSRWT